MAGHMQVVLSQNDSDDQVIIGQQYYQSFGLPEPVWENVLTDFYAALTTAYPEADEYEWRYETGEIIVCDDVTPTDEVKQNIFEMAQTAIDNNI